MENWMEYPYVDLLYDVYCSERRERFLRGIRDAPNDALRVFCALMYFHDCDGPVRVGMVDDDDGETKLAPFSARSNFKRGKCFAKAELLFTAGNIAIGKEPPNLQEALLNYSRSIAAYPYPFGINANNSHELALAFGSRSAVLHKMKSYEECLSDIEQALMLKDTDDKKYELYKRQGECFRAVLKVKEAINSFEAALNYVGTSSCNAKQRRKVRLQIKKHLEYLKTIDLNHQPDEIKLKLRPTPVKYGGENKEVPCVSAFVQIAVNSKWGRYLKSTQYIRPGEVLLVEKPYVFTLEEKDALSRCYFCIKKCDALIPCKTCSVVMFCSVTCRNASWATSHELECPLMYSLKKINACTPMIATLRMLLLAVKQHNGLRGLYDRIQEIENNQQPIQGFNREGKFESSDYYSVHNMFGSIDGQYVSALATYAHQCALIFHCIKTKTKLLDDDSGLPDDPQYSLFVCGLLMKYRLMITLNSLNIVDFGPPSRSINEFTPEHVIGFGMYPTSSLLNHSCVPNSVYYNRGDTLVLISSLPINKGEQIFICYEWTDFHPIKHSLSDRRVMLTGRYLFNCKCKACLKEMPEIEEWMDLLCPQCHKRLPQKQTTKCRNCKKKCNVDALRVGVMKLLQEVRHINQTSHDEKRLLEICALISTLSESADLTHEIIIMMHDLMRSVCGQAGDHFLK